MTRFLAFVGIVGISFSAILVKEADVSPSTAAVFRNLYALPVLFAIWLAVRRRDGRGPDLRIMALASGLFLALDLTVWHRSIDLIGAGLATVLANTQVVFVGLVGWLVLRERPTGLALFMVPIVFLGVVLISGLGREDAFGDDPWGGVGFGLVSGASYAAFLLIFRASNRDLVPAAGPLLDATVGTALAAFVLGVTDSGFSLAPEWPAHGWLVLLAVGAQSAGWLLIAEALPRVPALETSVMLLVQPMLTVLWGLLLFSEDLSGLQWTGVALVLGGVAVLTLRGSVERPVEAPAEP